MKKGSKYYTPDFYIIGSRGNKYYVEVKGYMDQKSATKLKRMQKYFPNVVIKIIGKEWFRENGTILRNVVNNWEHTY